MHLHMDVFPIIFFLLYILDIMHSVSLLYVNNLQTTIFFKSVILKVEEQHLSKAMQEIGS